MNCNSCGVSLNQVKAVKQNITAYKGDTFDPIIFKFWSDVAKTIPIDISANTYQMRLYLGNTTRLIFDTDITDPNILTATTDELNTLNPITYQWDLKQTDADGNITTYRYGDFRIIVR